VIGTPLLLTGGVLHLAVFEPTPSINLPLISRERQIQAVSAPCLWFQRPPLTRRFPEFADHQRGPPSRWHQEDGQQFL